MSGTSLTRGYLAALSARLPASIVEELADGLQEAYLRFRDTGMDDNAAAEAAITEFGDPQIVADSFTATCPGRLLSRRLLLTGPAAGLSWGAVLITAHAWAWTVPPAARVAFSTVFLAAIAMLNCAAFGRSYRAVTRSAVAGCVGVTLLDLTMIGAVFGLAIGPGWLVAVAVIVSGLRTVHNVRGLPGVLAG
jgi:hypothetical protein